MKLFDGKPRSDRDASAARGSAGFVSLATGLVCLQCGMIAGQDVSFCRRCGLPIGAEPRKTATLPTCPVCYVTVDDDGRIAALRPGQGRVDLVSHMSQHDQFPVGDDDYLESLRSGDLIVIDRWQAPFDLVRRYLVTGALGESFDAHPGMGPNAIVSDTAQLVAGEDFTCALDTTRPNSAVRSAS